MLIRIGWLRRKTAGNVNRPGLSGVNSASAVVCIHPARRKRPQVELMQVAKIPFNWWLQIVSDSDNKMLLIGDLTIMVKEADYWAIHKLKIHPLKKTGIFLNS